MNKHSRENIQPEINSCFCKLSIDFILLPCFVFKMLIAVRISFFNLKYIGICRNFNPKPLPKSPAHATICKRNLNGLGHIFNVICSTLNYVVGLANAVTY